MFFDFTSVLKERYTLHYITLLYNPGNFFWRRSRWQILEYDPLHAGLFLGKFEENLEVLFFLTFHLLFWEVLLQTTLLQIAR